MIDFLDIRDTSSPISDIKKEEKRLTQEERLLNEINQGIEDGLETLELSDKLDYSLAGLEHYSRVLPIYNKAFEIVNDNLSKVLDYSAGIEDNLEIENIFKQTEYVVKTLNIDIIEFDAGLLSNDPEDKEENENILIKILKKIWSAITSFIKAIVSIISKIITTFFKFTKKILGFSDPAAKIKAKIKEIEEKRNENTNSSSSFSMPSFKLPKESKKKKKKKKKHPNERINSNTDDEEYDDPATDNINDETIEANDNMENREARTMDPRQELAITKEMEDKLEDMTLKIMDEYPLAIVIADHIYEFEDGEIDLIDLIAVLYLITISSTSAVLKCKTKKNYSIERHIEAFIKGILKIEDIFDREKHLKGKHANNNFLDTATFYRLYSFVETVYPIYSGKNSPNESLISLIRNVMKGYGGNLTIASDSIQFHLANMENRFNTVNTKIDLNSIFIPILEDKLGEEFTMGMESYVPVTNKLTKNGVSNKYKYFRSAVLSFNKKEIELLVHLTNIANYDDYINNLNLPDPGMSSTTHKSAKSIEESYKDFFKNILPSLAKKASGELQIITIKVTEEDLKKYLPGPSKSITSIAPFMDEDKLVTIKLLDNLSKALGTNSDDIEKCLKYTDKDLSKISNHISNIEKLIDKFIKHMGTQRAVVDRGEPKARYTLEAGDTSSDDVRSPKEALGKKQALVSSLRKGILTTSQALQSTSNDLLKIYKNTVIPNLRNVKTLATEKVLTTFINELIEYYEARDGVGGKK